MGSTFNPPILAEKLTRLNCSQQSIETLSHWCIFHMNKAKQVVETWDLQFHSAPREQRLAFLYLANDILQNSRRKGLEFVTEFWKVLPCALHDVIDHGDESSRNAAVRLVNIWDDRKIFGSRGQILKEGISGRMPENGNLSFKLRHPGATTFDKIGSDYRAVYGGDLDEDVILNQLKNSVSSIDKLDKQVCANFKSGNLNGTEIVELQGQQGSLKECIHKLLVIESSRENLVNHLREALQEEEFILDYLRNQLQAAQSHSDHADNLCHQLQNAPHVQLITEPNGEVHNTSGSNHVPQTLEQSAPVMFSQQMTSVVSSVIAADDPRKSAAAAVAAKLTASSSSAQMLSYVLSSLASEGVIVNPVKEPTSEYHPDKKARLDMSDQVYIPQPPPPLQKPFIHPATSTGQKEVVQQHPHLSPPSMPGYMQNAVSLGMTPYSYGPPPPGYSSVGAHVTGISTFSSPPNTNAFYGLQTSEGGFYTQSSSLPLPPMTPQP